MIHEIVTQYHNLASHSLFSIGLMLILVDIAIRFSDKVKIPHVLGYMILGLVIGKSGLHLIPDDILNNLDIITIIALGIIGFVIGGELKFDTIKEFGWTIPIITVFETFGAFFFVLIGLYLLTKDWVLALIFASIAGASAPAATVQVLWQYGAKGPLTTTILAVVGLDDALVLMIYAFGFAYAKILLQHSGNISFLKVLEGPIIEIIGSIVVGAAIGLFLVKVLPKIENKTQLLTTTLGGIALGVGISRALGLSLILTTMVSGIVLVNRSRESRRVFDSLNLFSFPFYALMFMLLGAHLEIVRLKTMGILGIVYIITRSAGLILGGSLGAHISKAQDVVKKYLGFGLLAQTGVAIGIAFETYNVLSKMGPEGLKVGTDLINIIAATCIVFATISPPLVKYAIFKAKEVDPKYLKEGA